MQFQDHSGDKKYFTIIPNMLIEKMSSANIHIYMIMKRISGDSSKPIWISKKYLMKRLEVGHTSVTKALAELEAMHLIEFRESRDVEIKGVMQKVAFYSIQDIWQQNFTFFNKNTKSKDDKGGSVGDRGGFCAEQGGVLGGTLRRTSTKNKQEDTLQSSGNTQIPALIKEFEPINVASKRFYGHATQREACADLIKAFGFERVIAVIKETLPRTNTMQYFPNITTPVQLRDKWATLENAILKYRSENITNREKYPII